MTLWRIADIFKPLQGDPVESTLKKIDELTRHAFGLKRRLIFSSVDETGHIKIEIEGTPIAETRPTVARTLAALAAQVTLIRAEALRRELSAAEESVAAFQAIADAEAMPANPPPAA